MKIAALFLSALAVVFLALEMPSQAQNKPAPAPKEDKTTKDKFPDLPFALNTGAVTISLPTEMGVLINDRPLGMERTVWLSKAETSKVAGRTTIKPVLLIVRLKNTEASWKEMPHTPEGWSQVFIDGLTKEGKEVQSKMIDSTPEDQKALDGVYREVQDPRKVFGNDSIRYAYEFIDTKQEETNGHIDPSGVIRMGGTIKYFQATAYIVDRSRKTYYAIMYQLPGEVEETKLFPPCLRVVMSAETTKPTAKK